MMPHRDWIQDGRSPAREVHQEHMSAADIAAAQQWVNEINTEHHDELELIARIKGTEDGVDWRTEELDDVHLAYADEDGLHLEEVLCSSLDDRCVAIDLPVPWPSGMPLSRLPEMRQAYNDIVQKAYASAREHGRDATGIRAAAAGAHEPDEAHELGVPAAIEILYAVPRARRVVSYRGGGERNDGAVDIPRPLSRDHQRRVTWAAEGPALP